MAADLRVRGAWHAQHLEGEMLKQARGLRTYLTLAGDRVGALPDVPPLAVDTPAPDALKLKAFVCEQIAYWRDTLTRIGLAGIE